MVSTTSRLGLALAAAASLTLAQVPAVGSAQGSEFTRDFFIEDCDFASRGENPFFILQPGYRLILEGTDEGEEVVLQITVLGRTRVVDGVTTRVVEEREFKDGKLFEVSRNFYAICRPTNSVFYFGEEVDFYENGKVVGHEGSWRAGADGALPGVIMPGTILLGSRYFQEIAAGVALDRAEIVSLDGVVETPLARFTGCLRTRETTPLEPFVVEFKSYAPGVGLIKDGPLRLVRAFFVG